MFDLVALSEAIRGIDIKNSLEKTLRNADFPLNEIVIVATDGAPVMIGKNIGLIALKSDLIFPKFIPVH